MFFPGSWGHLGEKWRQLPARTTVHFGPEGPFEANHLWTIKVHRYIFYSAESKKFKQINDLQTHSLIQFKLT